MTDQPVEFSDENPGMIPEVVDDAGPPFVPEGTALIDENISYINRTVSAKALETALLIGDYILTYYFNDDINAAFSQNPYKSISFSMLCDHPDLIVSHQKLLDTVKVAAQERYFK